MNVDTQKTYSEVYGVLKMLGDSYISKLPTSLYNIIKEERLDSYNPSYIKTIDLKKQNIKRETIAMIAVLHLNYWCNSDEEKNRLKTLFSENEDKYQAEITKKYDVEDLLKKRKKEEIKENKVAMIEYKESIFKRILNKIKQFFRI